jgi:predicted nucleic acid-binding protein
MILADTSIWIDHLRARDPEILRQLEAKNIVTHPHIIAELALGSLRDRAETLEVLDSLPQIRVAEIGEVREMIEIRSLYSQGIGLTDAHLLASCLLDPSAHLWTGDKRLAKAAESLGIPAKLRWKQ